VAGLSVIESVIHSKAFENFTYSYFSMETLLNMSTGFPVNLLPRHEIDIHNNGALPPFRLWRARGHGWPVVRSWPATVAGWDRVYGWSWCAPPTSAGESGNGSA
jgi:hypothetical protein